MQGRIYISGAFKHVDVQTAIDGGYQLDNDPHFWCNPPTWGICHTEYRRKLSKGDYVFYVLPKTCALPQMIYAYMQIEEKITHMQAYGRSDLKCKRMRRGANPNGNIIVNSRMEYNELDAWAHYDNFERIREHYIVGSIKNSAFLSPGRITTLSAGFIPMLCRLFNVQGGSAVSILSRKGRVLNEAQIERLLSWLEK